MQKVPTHLCERSSSQMPGWISLIEHSEYLNWRRQQANGFQFWVLFSNLFKLFSCILFLPFCAFLESVDTQIIRLFFLTLDFLTLSTNGGIESILAPEVNVSIEGITPTVPLKLSCQTNIEEEHSRYWTFIAKKNTYTFMSVFCLSVCVCDRSPGLQWPGPVCGQSSEPELGQRPGGRWKRDAKAEKFWRGRRSNKIHWLYCRPGFKWKPQMNQ